MRKTNTVTIPSPEKGKTNRDAGKVFLLTEMPATQGEIWATRALGAMARSGVEMPSDMENTGMAGIASVGIRALLTMDFLDAQPLLEEMMGCVQLVPDPKQPSVARALVESDIEEVTTRLYLRSEVIALHLGFSIADALSKLGALAKNRLGNMQITPTPPMPSVPSSPPE